MRLRKLRRRGRARARHRAGRGPPVAGGATPRWRADGGDLQRTPIDLRRGSRGASCSPGGHRQGRGNRRGPDRQRDGLLQAQELRQVQPPLHDHAAGCCAAAAFATPPIRASIRATARGWVICRRCPGGREGVQDRGLHPPAPCARLLPGLLRASPRGGGIRHARRPAAALRSARLRRPGRCEWMVPQARAKSLHFRRSGRAAPAGARVERGRAGEVSPVSRFHPRGRARRAGRGPGSRS